MTAREGEESEYLKSDNVKPCKRICSSLLGNFVGKLQMSRRVRVVVTCCNSLSGIFYYTESGEYNSGCACALEFSSYGD